MCRPSKPVRWKEKCNDIDCVKRNPDGTCSVLTSVPVGECWARSEDPNWEQNIMLLPPKTKNNKDICVDTKCVKRNPDGTCSVLTSVPVGECWARSEDPNWEVKLQAAISNYNWYKNGDIPNKKVS